MQTTRDSKPTFRELALPFFLSLSGAGIVVWSVPGQGRTGWTALGMALALLGTAVARLRARRRDDAS